MQSECAGRRGAGNPWPEIEISPEAGIIDPTKVVRVALENAVSVSGVLLLTDATLTEVPEKKLEGAAALDQMSA